MTKCNTCGREFDSPNSFLKFSSRWRVCRDRNLWFNCVCGSTLVIPKGSYDWYQPDIAMTEDASSVFNTLARRDDIPYMSTSLFELQQLLTSESTSPHDLAVAAKSDPQLAAEILEIANMSRKAFSSQIRSLEHAIVFIGRQPVSELVAVAGAKTLKFKGKGYSPAIHWTHALLTGMIAEDLAHRYGQEAEVAPDEAYLAGALCNIGRVVASLCIPESTEKYWQTVRAGTHWRIAEVDLGLPDHRTLGEVAGALWGLPEFVIEVTRHHHDHPSAGQSVLDLNGAVVLANQWTHILLREDKMYDAELDSAWRQMLKIDDEKMQELLVEYQGFVAKSKSMAMGRV